MSAPVSPRQWRRAWVRHVLHSWHPKKMPANTPDRKTALAVAWIIMESGSDGHGCFISNEGVAKIIRGRSGRCDHSTVFKYRKFLLAQGIFVKTGGWSEAGVPVLNIAHFECCLKKICGGEGESESAVAALPRARVRTPQEQDGHVPLPEGESRYNLFCPGCRLQHGSKTIAEVAEIHHIALSEPLPEWLRCKSSEVL